jgi:hypothetical protein
VAVFQSAVKNPISDDRGGDLAFGLGAGHLDLGLLHTDERRSTE